MNELIHAMCVPCHGGEPKLEAGEAQRMLKEVADWQLFEEEGQAKIRKKYSFKDFRSALAFTDQVGELAERQGHHPVLVTEWGAVTVIYWTHATGGLHRNDFVMAAQTDQLFVEFASHG